MKIYKNKGLIKLLTPVLLVVFLMLVFVFSYSKVMWLKSALSPLVYSFVFAYLLDSVVRFCINRLKVNRQQAILLACIAVIGAIALLFAILIPKVVENINAVVDFFLDDSKDINEIVMGIKYRVQNDYVDVVADTILQTSEAIQNKINSILVYLSNVIILMIKDIGSKMLSIITSFIICIYILIEKDDLIARIKRFIYAFAEKRLADKIIYIGIKANVIFKSFLNGKILDSFIVSIICIILFSVFKVPYAPLMGTIIGFFNMIPYFGPIIGSVPVVAVSFFINPAKALTAMIIILIVQQVDGNYIDPKIVGNNIGVSPFWVITAVTVGGAAAGAAGMIFGVPVVVLVKTIVEESIDLHLKEKGIGDFEAERLKQKFPSKKIKMSIKTKLKKG